MVILQGIVIIVISAIESHKTILTRCSTVAPIVWPGISLSAQDTTASANINQCYGLVHTQC